MALPEIPPVPSPPAADAWQPVAQEQPAPWTVALDPQAPAPAPRPVTPGRDVPKTSPQPPSGPQTLPPPRGSDAPVTAPRPTPDVWGAPGAYPPGSELPPAPPALMYPHGTMVAPGKHGTFGSPPIRLSRDYPPLVDLLCGGWLTERDWLADGKQPTDRYYLQTELLLWWVRSGNVPPLATTTTATATDAALRTGFGFLGDPATRTLFGPGSLGDTFRPGFRVRGGAWFDDCGTCGIDGSFFFLGRRSGTASFFSSQTPVITRPFVAPNPEIAGEFGEAVALPGSSVGALTVDHHSSLWGADANIRHGLCRQCDFRAEVFGGYRFLSLDEGVRVNEYIIAVPGNPFLPAGTLALVQDRFETRNRFHGGQLGAYAERQWGRFSAAVRGSVARRGLSISSRRTFSARGPNSAAGVGP